MRDDQPHGGRSHSGQSNARRAWSAAPNRIRTYVSLKLGGDSPNGRVSGGRNHDVNWGALKDAPYEGFRLTSYLRSILLASALAVLFVATIAKPDSARWR